MMTRMGTSKVWMGLAICAALAGCGAMPDARYRSPLRVAPSMPPSAPHVPATPGAPASSAAEQACLSAGREAGFDVQGVVGTREVTGSGGVATSRDVVLDVRRGGSSIEVRCSYAYDSGTARIMTL